MQGERRAGQHGRDAQPGAVRSPRAAPRRRPALPTWESFPAADRHRLIAALLGAARRGVAAGPAGTRPTA
jgi:hypothetical protein